MDDDEEDRERLIVSYVIGTPDEQSVQYICAENDWNDHRRVITLLTVMTHAT